jgi:hypothetical protein
MNETSSPDLHTPRKPYDSNPPSGRWRQIPEPQPLVVEQQRFRLTPRRIGIAATGILCTVAGIFIFLKSGRIHPEPPTASSRPAPPPAAIAVSSTIHESPAPQNFSAHSPSSLPVAAPVAPVLSADERRIDQVLRAYTVNPSSDHSATAQTLINLLPTLTKPGQINAARHIANLLPDDDYQRVMPVWRNARSDRDVVEILGADLVNRDPKIMLPAMLEAVRQPSHPFHERGRQTLQLFLDADYGNDYAKWEEALRRHLIPQVATALPGAR